MDSNNSLNQMLEQNEEIRNQTQQLFEQLLKDYLQSQKDSLNNSRLGESDIQTDLNLSGAQEKQKFARIKNNRKFFEENKARYQKIMLESIRADIEKMKQQIKDLKQHNAKLQAAHNEQISKLSINIKQLMNQDIDKQEILVQITQLLTLQPQRQQQFLEWKKQIAEHRKIFTKYTTIMTECHPFAQENMIQFFKQVNDEFEFGLLNQIQKLNNQKEKSVLFQNLSPLHNYLQDSSINNTDKINKLYQQKLLSSNSENVSKDILHLLSINKADEIGGVYYKLVANMENKIRQQYEDKLKTLETELKNSIKVGMLKFDQLNHKYQQAFKISIKKKNGGNSINNLSDMNQYYQQQLSKADAKRKESTIKYNTRKTYFKLTQAQA